MKLLIAFALVAAISLAHARVLTPLEQQEADGRITNGQLATPGQFPYQALLSVRMNSNSAWWCGGSLIGRNWILTAAHCTLGAESVTVYLGSTVLTASEVKYTVNKNAIVIHPDYDSSNLKNDISLIKIPSVSYSNRVQAVKIPAMTSEYATYVGDYAIASGWGRTSDASNAVADDLQWARLQVVANSVCAATYGAAVVASSNICVATPNAVSTCNGDSGGPLVLESSKVQIGLTSYGAAEGCEKNHPVAFTRLTSYLPWIKLHTGISY